MSSTDESSSDEERNSDEEREEYEQYQEGDLYDEEGPGEEAAQSSADHQEQVEQSVEDRFRHELLFRYTSCGDAYDESILQQALRDGIDLNYALHAACSHHNTYIARALLNAGADPHWKDSNGYSAFSAAFPYFTQSSRTFKMLIHQDASLLENEDDDGETTLHKAIATDKVDMVQFLLDRGANVHATTTRGTTTLMSACKTHSLRMVRLLLAAGVDVHARDGRQRTALHQAAVSRRSKAARELMVEHHADLLAVDENGETPFDLAGNSVRMVNLLVEIYGNQLAQDHGPFALHILLNAAEYAFVDDAADFHPPLFPQRVILPLGKLPLQDFLALVCTLDSRLVLNRDENGQLPIHIACRTNAPVEFLSLLVKIDPTVTLQTLDHTGALPIHYLCCGATATEYGSVRYLVEQGGVGTLAARNHQGELPLHNLCASTNPSLRTVQYLIQSFPRSVAMRTNAGEYPFMIVACGKTMASLSVVYTVVRANPDLV